MKLSKRTSLIFMVFSCSVLFSVLVCCLFVLGNSKEPNKTVNINNNTWDVYAADVPDTTGLYNVYFETTQTYSTLPAVRENAYLDLQIKGMLYTLATGDTLLKIYSQDDLKYYANVTNHYEKVQSGSIIIDSPILGAHGYTIPTYDNEYPFNFALYVYLAKGWHIVEWNSMEKINGGTRLYGIGAYFAEDYDYISNPYRCEIMLENDITVTDTGCRFREFGGIFNGNSHAITYNCTISETISASNIHYGMFCKSNSGTIVNLRINNSSIEMKGAALNFDPSYAAVFAGYNSGTIEKCIVYNPKFKSERWKEDGFIAPIASSNSGTVQYCLVFGTFTISTFNSSHGANTSYFVNTTNEATGCVFAATVSKEGDGKSNIGSPGDYDTNAASLGNWTSDDSAHSATNLPSAWYKYNAGYPGEEGLKVFLKAFMSFTYYKFEVYNSEQGSVGIPSLNVPKEYDDISYATTYTENDTITVYGVQIVAIPTTGYKFSRWSESYTVPNTYYAYFGSLLFTIQFNNIGEVSPECEDFESGTTKLKIAYGSEVEVNCGRDEDSGKTLIYYEIGEHIITYKVELKYTINSYGSFVIASDNSGGIQPYAGVDEGISPTAIVQPPIPTGVTVNIKNMPNYYYLMNEGTVYSITPTIRLKTYRVTFE